MRHILDELPETLDATYERILQEIPKPNRVHAHRLLQCLTVAIRPLVVEELAEVLAMDFDGAGWIPKLSEGFRWADQEQAVLSACSSLITIVKDQDSRLVQFSHFSVKEFLTSGRLATSELNALRYHHIDLESAHTIMTRVCLGVLFQLDESMDKETIRSYPLVKYAGKFWVNHAEDGNVFSWTSYEFDALFDPDKPHLKILVWLGNEDAGASPRNLDINIDPGSDSDDSSSEQSSSERSFPKYMSRIPPYVYTLMCRGALLKHLILQRAHDLDASDMYGKTTLHVAAFASNFEATQMLIEHTADINARDNRGCTPLHYAVVEDELDSQDDHFRCVQLLLERGADADAQNNRGTTPLHLAASDSDIDEKIVQILIENVTNINLRNVQGQTALHKAVRRGDTDITSIILNHGADVDAQDNGGSTPLHLAISDASLPYVEQAVGLLLKHGANINLRNGQGQTALHKASLRGDPEIIQLLLDHDADADALDDEPRNLTQSRSSEAVQLALGCHANTNIQDNEGQTPLHTAVEAMGYGMSDGHCNVIRSLLDHHAKVDARDRNQLTPLHLASRYGNAKGAQLLLERGASVHVRNKWKTLLHEVLESGFPFWAHHLEFTRLLLNHGADVDAQDDSLSTPLHLASCKGLPKATMLLLEHGANVQMQNSDGRTPLHCVAQYRHLDTMRLLLGHNANVDARDRTQSTPLHLASCEGSLGAAQLLLEHGADVNVRDEKGGTPLHDATWGGHIEVMELLLEQGADVNAQSNKGASALHLALYKGDLGVVQALLQHGANVDLQDLRGETPFQIALGRGWEKIMSLLSEYRPK